jgi:hypothetical protein
MSKILLVAIENIFIANLAHNESNSQMYVCYAHLKKFQNKLGS